MSTLKLSSPDAAECPCCGENDSALRIAIHLIDEHHWLYGMGMDWLRNHEESRS